MFRTYNWKTNGEIRQEAWLRMRVHNINDNESCAAGGGARGVLLGAHHHVMFNPVCVVCRRAGA